VDRSEVND